jgi:hypothetical protein
VLCKVTVALLSEGYNLLLAVLLKHRIPLLLLLVGFAKCLESHCNVKIFSFPPKITDVLHNGTRTQYR